jgi:hypothetical protein
LQALVFAAMGRGAQALAIVDTLKNAAPGNATGIAQTYFALGDRDHGLEQLTKAFDARVGTVRWAMVDPSYESVRQDPRFQALVARLNFPSSVTTPRR